MNEIEDILEKPGPAIRHPDYPRGLVLSIVFLAAVLLLAWLV